MSENLRDRYARAIWEASRADEGTISAIGAQHVARAVLAVRDDLLAEVHVTETMVVPRICVPLAEELMRSQEREADLVMRAEAAEAEVARLSALQSVACQGCGADAEACAAAEPKCCPDCWPLNMHRAFADGIRAQAREARLRETVGRVEALLRGYESWTGVPWDDEFASSPKQREQLRAALAPRPSATEAPRTRDGGQECTGASGCCTACNGTGGGEIGGSCWDCRGTGHPHPPLDGDGERCGSGTPPVSVPDIAAPSVAANDDEQGEWGDDDLPTPDEALRMGWTV